VKRPIGQAAHLRVSALACVPAQSVWQGAYLLKSQQHRCTKNALTQTAACTVLAEG